MNAIDLPRRQRPFTAVAPGYSIDVYPGHRLHAVDWPSVTAPSDLSMYAFQSREFLDVWMNTIGKARDAQCWLVVVKTGDKPILYLPLVIERVFNIRLLRFMDAGVSDYNAPIVRSDDTLSRVDFDFLWPKILAALPKIDAIDLEKMPSDIVGRPNPLTNLRCVPYASSGHSLLLSLLHGAVGARHSVRAQRKNLRRRYRALSELGQADFVINPTGIKAAYVLDRLLDLKRQKYLRTTGRDFLTMPGVTRFYREMTAPSRLGRISHLSAVLCNDRVASAHLGFIGRGRFHYAVPAYDLEYRRFEVGHLLLEHLIDGSFEQGSTTYDLGVGDFAYKGRWSTHRLTLRNCEKALTFTGWLYFKIRHARRFAGATRLGQWIKARRRV
ncbi:MAG TPA: GNAT family N-acetyltransferase [Xanthobacteraceae bacterium]|nr:GNAT family N-acetyltransferase [Xanthobacteraceae bacterium]